MSALKVQACGRHEDNGEERHESVLKDPETWRKSWNCHVVSKHQEGLEVTGNGAGPDNGSHCPERRPTKNQLPFWDGVRIPSVAVLKPRRGGLARREHPFMGVSGPWIRMTLEVPSPPMVHDSVVCTFP